MMDENRIVPSGELDLGSASLDEVVTDGATEPTLQVARPGAFPVDDEYLTNVLVDYLSFIPKDLSQDYGGVVELHSLVNPEMSEVIKRLGHQFFKLTDGNWENHPFKKYGVQEDSWILSGTLNISREVPFETYRFGITQELGSDDLADYYIQEFGDRTGLNDPTKPIDLTKPELNIYIPGLDTLNQVSGTYFVVKNPYLLLLALDPEDRPDIQLFFDEARNNGIRPLEGSISYRHKNYAPTPLLSDYAITHEDRDKLIEKPHIIPFTEVLKTGKKYDIQGLAHYTDRLEEFNTMLKNIPSA